MGGAWPLRTTSAILLVAAATLAASGQVAAATSRVRDDSALLSPSGRVGVETRAAAVAAEGSPVLVMVRRLDESQDQTIADAAALMTSAQVESSAGAHDGLVVLVSLRPGDTRHGTAAMYAGEALSRGRVPPDELQRVYDEEMAPQLHNGDVAGAVEAGLIAVAHDLRDGPPAAARSVAQRGAASVTRLVLDPATVLLLALVAVMGLRVWRRRSVVVMSPEARPAQPGDAPPAIAGALWQSHVHPSQVRATLIDLAHRGAVRMEGGHRGSLRLQCVDVTAVRTAWERELWSALVASADAGGWVSRRRLGGVLNRPQRILRELRADLCARGLFEPHMADIRRPLRWCGVAGLVLTAVTAATGIAGLETWGWLGVAAAASASFLGFSIASRLPEVTPEGGAAAARWECYRRVLAAGFGLPDDPVDWDRHLGHAVALCLEREMEGRLVRDSRAGYVPAWADLRERDGGGFEGLWLTFDGTGDGGSGGGGGGDAGGAAAGGAGAGGSF
ncbi:MAG TPA: TPM domain-containing protein [Candidatus Dormibacteraeota bacterium]|nr:TPM domain-containing protein [Candidatus Dormibacteraeota bacterium]